MLYALPPSAAARQFGTFFVAGVGDVDHDHVPDVYGADYAAADNGPSSGFAGVYSGRDGTLLQSWTGAAGDGLGPGRGAGDVDRDHRPDLAIGSYLNSDGAPDAGKIELYSGATGAKLRTITSTTAGENLGFDAVGVGDVNRDHRPDLLALGGGGRHGLHDRRARPAALGGRSRPGARAAAASGGGARPGRRRRRGRRWCRPASGPG